MSKSLGNYIGITEPAEQIFGKTMSIPDNLIYRYFELVSSYGPAELADVEKRLADPSVNPSHLKRELARNLVEFYYDADAAAEAERHFDTVFVQKDRPDDIETVKLDGGDEGVWVVKALTESGMCESSSAARRMIGQGAVRIDGEKIDDVELKLAARENAYAVKVGKRRFVDIVVR
jgi:tyrosyl-tRNA synthetase